MKTEKINYAVQIGTRRTNSDNSNVDFTDSNH